MITKALIKLCRDTSLDNMDVDGLDRLSLHRNILEKKRMLRDVFTEFHHLFYNLDKKFFNGQGLRVELGAGVAPIKDTYPEVLATDIVYGSHLDRELNAEKMDLDDGSVRAFFGQNCFHHFPHPDQFFNELERVLIPGGGVILLEPYYGPFAEFLFKRIFSTEGYDKNYPCWDTPAAGPMNGANQALSYIIFMRDRDQFRKKHPTLNVVEQLPVGNHLKYLLSGGLNFRQMCPDVMIPIINTVQWCLSPLNRWLSLHYVIVIRKELV